MSIPEESTDRSKTDEDNFHKVAGGARSPMLQHYGLGETGKSAPIAPEVITLWCYTNLLLFF